VSKTAIFAWGISALGMLLWLYGYFATGTPPMIDWHAHTPSWIADFLPNIQSEIGMALICIGTALVYWPSQR
jgi:protein-S-isoprenylcysteine O-methyltransferase Ste14